MKQKPNAETPGKQMPQKMSAVILEKLMDLEQQESIPTEILSFFKEKYPDKSDFELRAFIAGFRIGLKPEPFSSAQRFLSKRKHSHTR